MIDLGQVVDIKCSTSTVQKEKEKDTTIQKVSDTDLTESSIYYYPYVRIFLVENKNISRGGG